MGCVGVNWTEDGVETRMGRFDGIGGAPWRGLIAIVFERVRFEVLGETWRVLGWNWFRFCSVSIDQSFAFYTSFEASLFFFEKAREQDDEFHCILVITNGHFR